MKPGDVVDAPDVPASSLSRDNHGTYYWRRGAWGQVARGVGPLYAWGALRRFPWFRRGRFELVAVDVEDVDLGPLIEQFEREHGVADFDPGVILAK